MTSLGRAIALLRTIRGLDQSSVAESAGLSKSYVSLLEGDKRNPTLNTLEALSGALRVSTAELFLLSDPHPTERSWSEATGQLVARLLTEDP